MANKPENLKPFKKGGDPRRHIKQKGEISAKTKFRNFIEDYFNYKKSEGVSKEKAIKELMERFDKFSKKEARILTYLGDRIYGKQTEKVDLTTGGEQLGVIILPAKQKKDENSLEATTEAGNSLKQD